MKQTRKPVYSSGDLAASLIYFSITFFYYLTDGVKMNPALAGLPYAIGQVWDGVNDPIMGVIAETSEGRPAGFLVCLPDVYQMMKGQPVTRVRIVTIGVASEFQRSDLGMSMVSELVRRAEGRYREGEVLWIWTTAHSRSSSPATAGRRAEYSL